MKSLLVLISSILFSANAVACYSQAVSVYTQAMNERRHDNIHVYNEAVQLKAGQSYDSYGVIFEYEQDVLIFEGSSEFMSGFGVEAIVLEPNTCRLIEMVQVYAE